MKKSEEKDTNKDIKDAPVKDVQEEQAKEKIEEYTNQLKRLQAEFENYVKREEKGRREFIDLANSDLISKLLATVNDFELAIKRLNDIDAGISEGVKMVFKNFMKILEEQGLRKVPAKGVFDPYVHEVLLKKNSAEPEFTILQVVQDGFFLKDKLLKPSKVIVSKGSSCLDCKSYRKVGELSKEADGCVNKSYIEKQGSKDKEYHLFKIPSLPKDCPYHEAKETGGKQDDKNNWN